jgi:tetratricopeptide (TPR) repeat protein
MKSAIVLALFLCYSFSAHGQSERSLIREGNRSYKDNKFTDAEVNYRKALEKDKELGQGIFDLGDALYKQGRFGEAVEEYGNAAAKATDSHLKAQALHNLGNGLLKDQKLPESISAYKEALKLNPTDEDTKYNLEYAKALLKRQQQQQQQNQKKDQKKDDKNKQDKQKQDQQKQDQQKQDEQKKEEQNKPDKQNQAQQDQKQAQQKKQQISKEDAARILEALNNEEKNIQKKLHKKIPARVKVEKDW